MFGAEWNNRTYSNFIHPAFVFSLPQPCSEQKDKSLSFTPDGKMFLFFFYLKNVFLPNNFLALLKQNKKKTGQQNKKTK